MQTPKAIEPLFSWQKEQIKDATAHNCAITTLASIAIISLNAGLKDTSLTPLERFQARKARKSWGEALEQSALQVAAGGALLEQPLL